MCDALAAAIDALHVRVETMRRSKCWHSQLCPLLVIVITGQILENVTFIWVAQSFGVVALFHGAIVLPRKCWENERTVGE